MKFIRGSLAFLPQLLAFGGPTDSKGAAVPFFVSKISMLIGSWGKFTGGRFKPYMLFTMLLYMLYGKFIFHVTSGDLHFPPGTSWFRSWGRFHSLHALDAHHRIWVLKFLSKISGWRSQWANFRKIQKKPKLQRTLKGHVFWLRFGRVGK